MTGGKTFERIAWLTPDPLNVDISLAKPAYACMPGITGLKDGTVLAAVRWSIARHKWTDLFASTDGGKTWQRRSVIFNRNNNPASLVDLGGGRLAAVYGYRNKPYGVQAKISEDAGHTWSKPFVLCDDGREWDLGYIRTALRNDGKITAVFYHTTEERPDEFIQSTIWAPPSTTTAVRQLAVQGDGTIIDSPITFDGSQTGIVIDAEHPMLSHGRDDFTVTGRFQTPSNEREDNLGILDNKHGLGGFCVMVGRADRSYKGKLFVALAGPGEGDDLRLFSDERVDDNQPHDFRVEVRGGVVRMFVDGVEQKETAAYGPGTVATSPPMTPAAVGGAFVGRIDELRVTASKKQAKR